ncbi:unnamed protein product [Rhizophagus irregularis]|nr:unnamed protein product [Rhizophagus irregularis]CAB5346160.1 unnamed protein product [Rhizophagus irregularis]
MNIKDEYNPLFEYPKYLKYYNYYGIDSTIFEWFKGPSNFSYNQNHKNYKNFCSIFHQSILNNCNNIEQFNIDYHSFIKSNPNFIIPITNLTKLNSLTLINLENFDQEIEKDFLNNSSNNCLNLKKLDQEIEKEDFLNNSSNNCLNLKKLDQDIEKDFLNNSSNHFLNLEKLDQEIEKDFLNNLSNHCLNLKKLEIFLRFDVSSIIRKNLFKIIQNQYNLKEFKISSLCLLDNNLISSLEFQKNSLVHIEFSNIDFRNISFKNFINLYNLEYLKFVSCKDINPLDRYEILKFATFKLKKLEFKMNVWDVTIEPTIIKYLGSSLQSLLIGESSMIIPMIENILIYCLNLITLEIEILYFKNIDLLVFQYFKNLEIKKLIIDSYGGDGRINDIFINLAINLSIDVKEFSFLHYSRCNQLLFKSFLENCHNHLEKICLNFSLGYNFIDSEFLTVILNYIEKSNNSLKFLNFISAKRILNEEELRLLTEIKAKGIRIVIEFY